MEDEKIIELYWQRKETAIGETQKKDDRYLGGISYRILSNKEDSAECVNDTYLAAWNAMPPHRPSVLAAFLGKITRQLSIDKYRRRNSAKRRPSEYALSLEELEDCVSGTDTLKEKTDLMLLAEAITEYLRGLPEESRKIFLCRYFYADSIQEIASYQHASPSKIKSQLHRTRIGLRAHLEQAGWTL